MTATAAHPVSPSSGPLHGLRVVELAGIGPGPHACMLLADLGAEVIRVERVVVADGVPTIPDDATLRSRRIVTADLKDSADLDAVRELIDRADVLIEGFRPGVMQRLGLDHTTLRERNPRLIYCSLSGYGAEGPLSQAAGHDGNYLALAGVLHRNGVPPRCFDPPIADMTSGLFAVIAILGALECRRRDGLGCHIDLGIADVAMPLQLFQLAALDQTVPQPETTYLNGGAAYYRTYATRDGRHVTLGAVEPKFWRAFCDAAERPDWLARQQEPLPQTGLIRDLAAHFATLSLSECEARFNASDCCVSAVLDLAEAVATPHHATRGVIHRAPLGGWQALFPALIDAEPPAPRSPPSQAGVMRWGCESNPE